MTSDQFLTALPIVAGVVIAWWGYQKSKKTDEVTVQSGMAIEQRMALAQVQAAYERLADTYQEDNVGFRTHIQYLDTQLEACIKVREEQRIEIARLIRKHGENGPQAAPSPQT